MLPKLKADYSPKGAEGGHPNGVKHEGKSGLKSESRNEGVQAPLPKGKVKTLVFVLIALCMEKASRKAAALEARAGADWRAERDLPEKS